MPNDIAVPVVVTVAVAGKVSQLAGSDRLTVTVPLLDERVEDLADVVPPCTTEKASDVGENANVGVAVTVRVTAKVVVVYPVAVAVTVVL